MCDIILFFFLLLVRLWLELSKQQDGLELSLQWLIGSARAKKVSFLAFGTHIRQLETFWALLLQVKLRHYEKASKFEKNSHLSWQNSCFYSVFSKQVGDFFQIFVAFSEKLKVMFTIKVFRAFNITLFGDIDWVLKMHYLANILFCSILVF